MSYRNDQWFRLNQPALTGENLIRGVGSRLQTPAGYVVPGADNDPFIYPSRVVRTVDGKGNHKSEGLKRGYIRSLLTGDGRGVNKCQFQFNPSSLNQSVTQNTGILNFLQIDQYQYSQPVPGNVTFQFDLFFDRSMELNSGMSESMRDVTDPWNQLGPESIGVLHDLAALYSIIGVGIGDYIERNMVANATESAYLDQAIDAAIDKRTTELTAEDAVGQDASTEREDYKTRVDELLAINKGNTAFLLPLPVRIVFSSLYIVEGLVQDFNVLFTKFTTNMVPMQCSVTVTFEAKYIGFAKKETFFTKALEDLKNAGTKDYATLTDTAIEYLDDIIADLTTVTMVLNSGDGDTEKNGVDKADSWRESIFGGYENTIGLERFISLDYDGVDYSSERHRASDKDKFVKVLFTGEQGRIYGRLTRGGAVSVQVDGNIEIYRFGDSFKNNPTNSGYFSTIEAEGGLDTAQYTPSGRKRDAAASIKSQLDTWIAGRSSNPNPNNPITVYERYKSEHGDTYDYASVNKIHSVYIGANNVYGDGGIVNASTADEWDSMRDWACTSDKQVGALDNDLNVSGGSGISNKYSIDHDDSVNPDVYYFAVFTTTITVSVDDFALAPQTSVDYRMRTQPFGSPSDVSDFDLKKVLRFDWAALRDDTNSTDNNSTGNNNGGSGDRYGDSRPAGLSNT